MNNDKKEWRARVLAPICTNNDDGGLVTLVPGEYTLSEGEGARYRLSQNAQKPISLSLWFADLSLCSYMGQVEILGMWP